MKSIVRTLCAACFMLVLIHATSASAATVSGTVTEVRRCGNGSSTRHTVVVRVQSGANSFWFWAADSNYPSSEHNQQIVLAALLSGKPVQVEHNSTGISVCGINTTGTLFTDGEYIRIQN